MSKTEAIKSSGWYVEVGFLVALGVAAAAAAAAAQRYLSVDDDEDDDD